MRGRNLIQSFSICFSEHSRQDSRSCQWSGNWKHQKSMQRVFLSRVNSQDGCLSNQLSHFHWFGDLFLSFSSCCSRSSPINNSFFLFLAWIDSEINKKGGSWLIKELFERIRMDMRFGLVGYWHGRGGKSCSECEEILRWYFHRLN